MMKTNTKLGISLTLLTSILGSPFAMADFVRGDLNHDNLVNAADRDIFAQQILQMPASVANKLIRYASLGGNPSLAIHLEGISCPDRADVNDDGVVDVEDYVYLRNFIRGTGAAPVAPYPAAGLDPSLDAYSCGSCFIAGNTAGNGWIKGFRPIVANPSVTSNSGWVLYDVLTTAGPIDNISEIAFADSSTLAVLNHNANDYSKISYVTLGGINQVGDAVLGSLVTSALGKLANGITVDAQGNFLIAEQEDNDLGDPLVTNQISFLNPFGGLIKTVVETNGAAPLAVRLDAQGKVWFTEKINNFASAVRFINPDDSLTTFCSVNSQPLAGIDLHINRTSQLPFFVADGSGSNEDILTYCPSQGSNYAAAAFGTEMQGDDMITVDQFPDGNQDFLLITKPLSNTGRIRRVTNVFPYDTVNSFTLSNTALAGATDVICSPTE